MPSKSDATTWYIKILTSKQGDERFRRIKSLSHQAIFLPFRTRAALTILTYGLYVSVVSRCPCPTGGNNLHLPGKALIVSSEKIDDGI